jgi:hypothetical protein
MISALLTIAFFTKVCYGQLTGITCSSVSPVDVPRDASLYWGTWFVIGTCDSCTNSSNVCSQVVYEPADSSMEDTNVTYIGSYQVKQPDGLNKQAFGKMTPLELETFNPLYQLDLDLGFAIIRNNFWILASASDSSGEITAMVTYSCGTDNTNAQLFYLSRYPYLIDPLTFSTLEGKVKRAITNYDEFNVIAVTQQQGWCEYQYTTDYVAASTVSCSSDNDDDSEAIGVAEAGSILSAIFSAISAGILIVACVRKGSQSATMDKPLL